MKKSKWEHIIILFIGIWLLSIPWTVGWGFGTNDINVVMWNFITIGVALIVTSVIVLRNYKLWAEWLTLFMGGWLLFSPLLLVYYDNSFFMWNSIVFGLATLGLSALSIPSKEKQLLYKQFVRKNQSTHNKAIKH